MKKCHTVEQTRVKVMKCDCQEEAPHDMLQDPMCEINYTLMSSVAEMDGQLQKLKIRQGGKCSISLLG